MPLQIDIIARIKTDFGDKFGVPRQSGMAENKSRIVFEPKYKNREALRGIEEYSHLWLIWEFSMLPKNRKDWSPTVRPPRLGGNKRVGVFATRSPFRPNPLGLSCVKLLSVENDKEYGLSLVVSGADMVDGTPIYDIKPYIPYADCIENATEGITKQTKNYSLEVEFSDEVQKMLSQEDLNEMADILKNDPRPSYQDDSSRIYGMRYKNKRIEFSVKENCLVVHSVLKCGDSNL